MKTERVRKCFVISVCWSLLAFPLCTNNNFQVWSQHLFIILLGLSRLRQTPLMLFVFDSLAVREFLCLDDPPGPFDSLEESRVSVYSCRCSHSSVVSLRLTRQTRNINVPLDAMRLLLLYINFIHFLLIAADPRGIEFSS